VEITLRSKSLKRWLVNFRFWNSKLGTRYSELGSRYSAHDVDMNINIDTLIYQGVMKTH